MIFFSHKNFNGLNVNVKFLAEKCKIAFEWLIFLENILKTEMFY